jgi:hypothetical protein
VSGPESYVRRLNASNAAASAYLRHEGSKSIANICGIRLLGAYQLGGTAKPRGCSEPRWPNGHGLRRCGVSEIRPQLPSATDLPGYGAALPNEVFVVVIFGSDRAKFGEPEMTLRGKRICVTGQVRNYRGKPEIVVSDPSQLTE